MYKFQILFSIIVFQLLRAVLNKKKIGSKYLIVSFFIITIPFEFQWTLIERNFKTGLGTLGTSLKVIIPLVLFLMLFVAPNRKIVAKIKFSIWSKLMMLVILISLVNPFNKAVFGTIIFSSFVLCHFLFFIYIFKTFTQKEVIHGFFDGFFILCVLQFVLAICFPLLGIREVTTLFHSTAGEWATRMDTRSGAVGIFTAPGNLALFTTIASSFFLGCYLNNFKKKQSLIVLLVNMVTLILTYSRTSYLAFIIVIFLVYFIFKNARMKIFTLGNFFKYIAPMLAVLVYVVFFSPLSNIFLKSDADEMLDARMVHWFMGFQIFNSSPIIGVGLNSHLEYMFSHFNLFGGMVIDGFFWENPIHNIHLIVLVETGLIGFVFWILFIFSNISKSKKDIAHERNEIFAATQIGMLVGIVIYGISGWAPFSSGILPFILMISFFAIQFRNTIKY
nr:O-antigen ligase family protein [uncultured Flavobacterium sp.]